METRGKEIWMLMVEHWFLERNLSFDSATGVSNWKVQIYIDTSKRFSPQSLVS